MAKYRPQKGNRMFSHVFQRQLLEEEANWEKRMLLPSLKSKLEYKEKYNTGSGEFLVKRLYSPADVANMDYFGEVGFPGQYPFTRGIDPLGLRAREWARHFYSGYGSYQDARQRYLDLIKAGANHISLAMDLPTQLGYDSDNPRAKGEVGKVGVALDTLEDMEKLFEGISLEGVTLGTVGNSIGPWTVAMFYCLAEKKGIDPSKVKVVLQNDPLKEYTGRGTQIFEAERAIDLAADAVKFCFRYLPLWEPQYACSTTMRWGGCNASQEVAFGIANLLAYVEAAKKKGIDPILLVPKMNLHMTSDNDLFEEVAKFRATRRLWAKICREHFHSDDPRLLALRLTVYTNATRLTAQQPLNNITRTTMHVLGAILGGAERINVPAYDEALALPTVESTWLADTIKFILTDENLVADTVDPFAGSYYVETLTNQIEAKAFEQYKHVEAMDGAVAAIKNGYYLQIMADGMYKYQQEVESGQRTVIGVNKFRLDEEPNFQIFRHNPKAGQMQILHLHSVKSRRDNAAVRKYLGRVRKVAESKLSGKDENIVPAIIDAVRAYASVGEIYSVLRETFGEFKVQTIF